MKKTIILGTLVSILSIPSFADETGMFNEVELRSLECTSTVGSSSREIYGKGLNDAEFAEFRSLALGGETSRLINALCDRLESLRKISIK